MTSPAASDDLEAHTDEASTAQRAWRTAAISASVSARSSRSPFLPSRRPAAASSAPLLIEGASIAAEPTW